MEPYFIRTPVDEAYYAEHLQNRLPPDIFDVHVHLNDAAHIANVPKSRFLTDWAMEAGHLLPVDDAYACVSEMFPGVNYRIAGMPWPIREADLVANNAYLAEPANRQRLAPFMAVRPEWSVDDIETALVEGAFVGFKPYPDMVSGVKGADMSIFDFLPHEQWEILNRHRKVLMLHLPRADRLAAPDNVNELLEARQKYPDVAIIVAHFGRAFCPVFLERGLDRMGDEAAGFFFDTTAVINPAVYDVAFSRLPVENILYGSDLPIFFWHGRREWTDRDYHNLCREDFFWNKERRSADEEAGYTFFLYEQMRAILDVMDKHGMGMTEKAGLFGANARKLLGLTG